MEQRSAIRQKENPAQSAAKTGRFGRALLEPVVGEVYRIKIDRSKGGPAYLYGKGYTTEAESAAQWVFHLVDEQSRKYILCTVRGPKGYADPGSVLYGGTVKDDPTVYTSLATDPVMTQVPSVWQLEDAGNNKFRLWCYGRALYVAANFTSGVFQLGDKKSDGSDLFELEKVGEYPEVIQLQKFEHQVFPAPDLTSMDEPPTYTDQVVAGEVAVPWFVVIKDGGKDDKWRAEHTPYYIIRRWSRWYAKDWEILKRTEARDHQWSITWGVSEEVAREIDENLNISVSAEAGLDISGFSAKLSSTISYGLNVKTTQRSTESYTKTETDNYKIGPDDTSDMAACDFYRQDQYRIYRVEGQEIREFPVTVPGIRAGRTYPPRTT